MTLSDFIGPVWLAVMSVVMLSVQFVCIAILSVNMLNVVILSVAAPLTYLKHGYKNNKVVNVKNFINELSLLKDRLHNIAALQGSEPITAWKC